MMTFRQGRIVRAIAGGACMTVLLSLTLVLQAAAGAGTRGFVLKEKQSCVSAECHPKLGKAKFVHGPTATGDCRFCHQQLQPDRHEFKAIKEQAKLCYSCHDQMQMGPVMHKPVKDGNCTGCHDPHQSDHTYQLRGGGQELCFRCHSKTIISGTVKHGPVAVGDCAACHTHHAGKYPKLLSGNGSDACYSCHKDKQADFASRPFVHAPMKTGCVQCHNPHTSNHKYILIGEHTKGVCFACHKDKQQEISAVKVKHGGLELENGCMACHSPHTSRYPKMVEQAPMDLCLSCHDREYVRGDKKTAEMKSFLARHKYVHGPIKQQDCSGCHNTHGSNYFRILRGNYPAVFYTRYNPENYRFCFNCHNENLAKDPSTTTMTGFRNGDQNLHYVHIKKPVKGRTCRACHDAHATNNPKHIRDAAPFGAWQMPVGLVKNANGGSCLPGCHQEFKYDRNRMVQNR